MCMGTAWALHGYGQIRSGFHFHILTRMNLHCICIKFNEGADILDYFFVLRRYCGLLCNHDVCNHDVHYQLECMGIVTVASSKQTICLE